MKKAAVLALLMGVSQAAFAAPAYYVACIYDFGGSVRIFKASKTEWKVAFKYMPLEEKDTIKTAAVSFCEIVLDDGSMIKLAENTELVLKQLKYELQKQKYRFGLNRGKVLGSVNKIKTAGASVTFKTPTSVAAVRGTELAVIVSSGVTDIGLFDGKLAVSAADEEDEAEEEAAFLAPTTAYETPAPAQAAKKEIMLEPNKEVSIGIKEEPVVKDYLSSVMEKEKRRCERLKEVAEKVREKLKARGDYLQQKISEQQEKLKDWDLKREEKLKRFRKGD
jgi:hypothetical protein